MRKRLLVLFLLAIVSVAAYARQPEFSTAGFFELEGSGRRVYDMNAAWRFHKGAAGAAETVAFDDSVWEVVAVPHGLEDLPAEASGCVNYQGEAWYRKHFDFQPSWQGKRLFLHFEAIMGKSKVWVNGKLLKEHFGGYLPLIVDVTDALHSGGNVIAVWADNSDDPIYPPGKPQNILDFSYFGGIYRDCWLIAHNDVYITDPNYENTVAGGGLFVAYEEVSGKAARVVLRTQVRNRTDRPFAGKVVYKLTDKAGREVAALAQPLRVATATTATADGRMNVKNPQLWSPENPTLYWLTVTICDAKGKVIDGYRRRIGIRSIEFKGYEGFWLNGKPYAGKLIGANRHQDFAVVGNALSNSAHWRDARKLRDVGLKVIRNAHYPQDPAFMDACDELGLFVIITTPGWQFWNEAPVFGQRVYSDVHNMVRRDRNHPSTFLWEPILNETWYPDTFAKDVYDIVQTEYPYPGCYAACDAMAKGHEYFPVLYQHPDEAKMDSSRTYFTREWGDNVDDWNSHNSPSRVSRSWGEEPMRIQARHYGKPPYPYDSYDALYRTSAQHSGGCLWHPFDHQRGYHPDPFYGGLMDAFRQPKYSYYMFMAQRPLMGVPGTVGVGPMVYIAHEMTPFSGGNVDVYSNCDEVRLTVMKDGRQYTNTKPRAAEGMPSPVIRFDSVYDFMQDKAMSRNKRQGDVYLLAEGLVDGKVVTTHKVTPARRPAKIVLWVDNEGVDLVADGSDFVTVVAAVADANGNIKRLNNYNIRFTIEGEGCIVGDEAVLANPRRVEWGTAPVLVRSTLKAGKIKVHAEVFMKGQQMPVGGEIEFESLAPVRPLVYDATEAAQSVTKALRTAVNAAANRSLEKEVERLQQQLNDMKLKEVERQQEDFGETPR